MREVADRSRIEAFLDALAREATEETDVYVVGGTSAVLVGWRESTIDIDLERGLVSRTELRRQFALAESRLYRYPAIDPESFRRAVEEFAPE